MTEGTFYQTALSATQSELLLPPHSLEAEQSILSGLLLDNSPWDRLSRLLRDTDFYHHEHQVIFQHIMHLIATSKPADVITVFEALQTSGKTTKVGGVEYLNALASNTPTAANIRFYAQLVQKMNVLKKIHSIKAMLGVLHVE